MTLRYVLTKAYLMGALSIELCALRLSLKTWRPLAAVNSFDRAGKAAAELNLDRAPLAFPP